MVDREATREKIADVIEVAGCVIRRKIGGKVALLVVRKIGEYWELPGGKIDPGETPEEAAAREGQEELGDTVEIDGELLEGTILALGDRAFRYTYFEAQVARPSIGEPDTHDAMAYMSSEELRGLLDEGQLSGFVRPLLDHGLLDEECVKV